MTFVIVNCMTYISFLFSASYKKKHLKNPNPLKRQMEVERERERERER